MEKQRPDNFDQKSFIEKVAGAVIKKIEGQTSEPLRIAVIGQSGVGKTSTINALFNTDMPVSHFASCTQDIQVVEAETPKGVRIKLIDFPGLWAGEAESKRHWETYKKVLPKVDCAIWVISAGDRALEGMQSTLKKIAGFSRDGFMDKVVFGVNKAEHMYPEKWNTAINQPNPEQERNLELFSNTVKKAVQEIFPEWNGTIRYYSAHKHYRLDELLEQMVLTAQKDSSQCALKIVRAADPGDPTDFIEDKRALDLARKMMDPRGED